jgi:hypothetical protein
LKDKICTVSSEGDTITIALREESDATREIKLSFAEARALVVALLLSLATATTQKPAEATEPSSRPVQDYVVECGPDEHHTLLTLSCDDGDIVFSIDVRMIPFLIRDLASGQTLLATPRPGHLN